MSGAWIHCACFQLSPITRRSGLLLTAFFLAASLFAQERRPAPHFQGKELPEPPAQTEPWQPPQTTLPKAFVSATEALFQARFADPRGCEYRVIKVAVGSCWDGGGGALTTHGWVLPAAVAGQRFAVCWNGLVYPALSVGDKADWVKDVESMFQAEKELEKRRGEKSGKKRRINRETAEASLLSHKDLLPLKACLLFRLGEEESAHKIAAAWYGPDLESLKDPLLELAEDWLWALFDRGLCAHMRGDDRLALASFRRLHDGYAKVESAAVKRGLPKPQDGNGQPEGKYFRFFGAMSDLLEDQERRAKEPRSDKLPKKDADPHKHIRALIRDLENIDARQWGQPGGISLNLDGRVTALAAQGRPAIEPLLECLEKDARLTRAVGFGRDFFRYRYVVTVAEAAHEALSQILNVDRFGEGNDRWDVRTPEGRRQAAAAIRAHWQRFKDRPAHERWMTLLTEDGLGRDQYLEAARKLLNAPRKELEKFRSPTVTEALVLRARALSESGAPGSERMWSLGAASSMALLLVNWDAKAAAEELPLQFERCRDYWNQYKGDALASSFASLSEARARFKDPKALPDFGAWLASTKPEEVSSYRWGLFAPFWSFPEDPAANRAVAALFADPKSQWHGWARRPDEHSQGQELITSPLLGLASYRDIVIDLLADKTKCGMVTLSEGGHIEYRTKGYTSGRGSYRGDPSAPPAGTEIEMRICDLVADLLSQINGLPVVRPYWPQAKRDRAITACIQALRRYGNRLQFDARMPKRENPSVAMLVFPALEEPASKEHVQFGQAIFSLDGQGKVRTVPLPQRPLKARWVANKEYPVEVQWASADGKSGWRTEYWQDGLVWQAEEVVRDGRAQRFYGFVGKGPVARVPAEEIEFPVEGRWQSLTNGIDAMASVEGKSISLRLRNRAGLEQSLPKNWISKDSLRAGLELVVEYTEKSDVQPWHNDAKWQMLKGKLQGGFAEKDAGLTLAPTVDAEVLRLNLGDYFDLKRAGAYRARYVFTSAEGCRWEGTSPDAYFVVASD